MACAGKVQVGRCGICDWCVQTLLRSLERQHALLLAAQQGLAWRAYAERVGLR